MQKTSILALVGVISLAAAQNCVFEPDSNSKWWMRCPFLGNATTLTMGVNHIENCDASGCPAGTFGPRHNGSDGLGGFCAWFCISYDSSFNQSAYLLSTQARYGSTEQWASSASSRLQSWQFNTVGSWSSYELTRPQSAPLGGSVYGLSLDMLLTSFEHRMLPHGGMPVDVFSSAFSERCASIAEKQVAPRANDTSVLGYWTDNESIWYPKIQASETPRNCAASGLLAASLVVFNSTSAGLNSTLIWLANRYGGDISRLNAAWTTSAASWAALPSVCPLPTPSSNPHMSADNEAYLEFYSEAYMATAAGAIRATGSTQMILGPRMNDLTSTGQAVVRGMSKYTDAVDVHVYEDEPGTAGLWAMHNASGGKPLLMSEFGFRARVSGLQNIIGVGPLLPDQTSRLQAARSYVKTLVELPFVVGYHLFAWVDEPSGGQLFGANSNYGLNHLSDDPYGVWTQGWTSINTMAVQWHENG
jgi:agarase